MGDTLGEYNGVKTNQDLRDFRTPEELRAEAVKAAADADIVLFFGGLNKADHNDAEDSDRLSMELPYGQDELIDALFKANKKLAVVNISGTGVAMPWANKVPAIIQAWYLGNETGNAIADVLSGDVNPSGKLPYTYYADLMQCGAHKLGEYPGTPAKDKFGNDIFDMPYNEGIFVGYRFIDKNKLKPTFPFGHGLSYTTFEYGKAEIDRTSGNENDKFVITVPVTNTGKKAGSEVVELYISDSKSSVERPVKELKGFSKVHLLPGETKTVKFEITKPDLSFFDAEKHKWVCEPGDFQVLIGSSSADIRTKVKFSIAG